MNRVTLRQILQWLTQNKLLIESSVGELLDYEVNGITDNSMDVCSGDVFFCKGAHFKKEYAEEALKKRVLCIITSNPDLVKLGNYILVTDIRISMAIVANEFYSRPWEKMTLIGITGTKGKSTSAYMVKSILDDYLKNTNSKCGILSSIENYDGKNVEESHLTTLEPLQLHKKFHSMVKNNCTFCVMEVSSQALKFDRVLGVTFDIGCFLNIGEDHISDVEHSSFEDYFSSKLLIASQSKKFIALDSLKLPGNTITFGEQLNSDYSIKEVVIDSDIYTFKIHGLGEFSVGMPGYFNILNAAAAVAISNELGIPFVNIKNGIITAKASGRMEKFKSQNKDMIAIVDYAHNKISYEALFDSIKQEYHDYKVVTIFGCPGNKAQKRRVELPRIAEAFSDYIYITEEDYGEESLQKICDEIYSNITKKSCAEIVLDREQAIQLACSKYDDHSLLLILGKGRETRQKRGTQYISVPSDVDIVNKYL